MQYWVVARQTLFLMGQHVSTAYFCALSSIRNRLLRNEDSLKNLVYMGTTLDSVVHKHGHTFPETQLDVLVVQSMHSLALELIYIHRIHHAGIRKQEERWGTPQDSHLMDIVIGCGLRVEKNFTPIFPGECGPLFAASVKLLQFALRASSASAPTKG